MKGNAAVKVTGLQTIALDNVAPFVGGQKWLFIELITDEGLVGIGERPTGGATNLKPQIEMLTDLFEQFINGEDPFNIERIWQRAFALRHDFRHPSMDATPALSALEMALWDIVGKATGQPIYNLLGGQYHERLRAYAYMPSDGIWACPAKAGEIAHELVDAGWSACKTDPFNPTLPNYQNWQLKEIKHAASIFRCIREAVGDELEVAIGTHGQFSTAGAIRVARIFEEFLPAWFEEPVPPENVEEMAKVASQTSIPIASGERLATKYEFANLIEKRAAGIIQLDVGQCGGILESKKIAAMAEAHHALIAPHMYVGPIAAAAAVQLDTCLPNFMIQEFNVGPLHSEIFVDPITVQQGYITPPSGPGLGVELNADVVARHRSR